MRCSVLGTPGRGPLSAQTTIIHLPPEQARPNTERHEANGFSEARDYVLTDNEYQRLQSQSRSEDRSRPQAEGRRCQRRRTPTRFEDQKASGYTPNPIP